MKNESQEIFISIDKLCIVADMPSRAYFDHLQLFYKLIDNFVKHKYIEPLQISNYIYTESFITIDNAFFQIGEKGIRVEFNPNLITEDTKELIKRFLTFGVNHHFTRIDIASDFYNYDLSTYNIINLKPIKKAYYYDRLGNLETVYFGSQKSDKFFRIYNKAKEQKLKNTIWWRVELQLRDVYIDRFFSQYSAFFQDLIIFRFEPFCNLPFNTRATLSYLIQDKTRFGELDKRNRKKYRDLIKSMELDTFDFLNDLVENSKDELISLAKTYII